MASGGLPPGSGALVVEDCSAPGAGAEAVLLCPAPQRRLVHAINFTYTTDANAGNRYAVIGRTIGTSFYQGARAPSSQSASTINVHVFQLSPMPYVMGSFPAGINATQLNTLPFQFWWYDGLPICIRSVFMQVGDQISDIHILYERWLCH